MQVAGEMALKVADALTSTSFKILQRARALSRNSQW
jgi:hypothetical protein